MVTKPPAGSRIKRGHPLTRGLYGCFLLNENSGRLVTDLARGVRGTVTESTPAVADVLPKWIGEGLEFNKAFSTQKVDCGTDWSFPDDLTVVTSYRLATTTDDKMLITKDASGQRAFNLYIGAAAGGLAFQINGGTGNDRSTYTYTAAAGESKTVAASYRKSDKQLATYVNGSLVKTQTADSASISSVTSSLEIGNWGWSGTFDGCFSGLIRYAYIYNRYLSPSEIAALYSDPYQIIEPSLAFRRGYLIPNPFLTVSKSDDLNNWGENQVLGWGIRTADNANNLADALAYVYNINVVALTRAVADNILNTTGPANRRSGLRDGIGFTYDNSTLYLSINDLGLFNEDDVQLTLSIFFNDAGPREAFDDLRNWADSVSIDLKAAFNGVGDSLSLNDQANLLLTHLLSKSDTLSLTDAIALGLFSAIAVADTLSMSDSVSAQLGIPGNRTAADNLNKWVDTVATLLSGTNATYLRRYLNDVIN
jgi:hypothetical protein